MQRAMKVPVRPTPALQCTTGIDASVIEFRKVSIKKLREFLPFLHGISPSGQSVSW